MDLIESLYSTRYRELVEGRERLRLLNASRITDVRDGEHRVEVSVEHQPTGRQEILDADLLVHATGYRPLDIGVLLGEAAKLCLHDEEDAIRVGRDHRVEVLPKVTAGIYLQGATEHSHGLSSTLLSTTAIRAGEIRASLLARLDTRARART
jgi:L-ornithine N5-oxygenase